MMASTPCAVCGEAANHASPWSTLEPAHVSALILAAGRAQRMGGVDKALMPLAGRSMVEHLIERIAPQVDHIVINAARNHDIYAQWSACVFADDAAYAGAGPLAGWATALARTRTPWVLSLACDTPFMPANLCARMAEVARVQQVCIVTASGPQWELGAAVAGMRAQPTVALLHRSLWADLDAFVRGGGRKIDAWTARWPHADCPFNAPGDEPWMFANANTPQELAALQALANQPCHAALT